MAANIHFQRPRLEYVPLWCKTNFSFLEGASNAEEMIRTSKELSLPALTVTDRNGFYGIVKAHVAAKEFRQNLICGSEVSVDDGSTIVLLAKTRAGYGNLCTALSKGHTDNPKGRASLSWGEICACSAGLVALWLHNGSEASTLGKQLELLKASYGPDLYAAVVRHLEADDVRIERETRSLAHRFGIQLVAATEVLYHTRERRRLQDVLACIRQGTTIMDAGTRIKSNAAHALLSVKEMYELYRDDPVIVERTLEVAAKCTFSLSELEYKYPEEQLGDGLNADGSLRRLTYVGGTSRYPGGIPEKVRVQIEKELSIIEQLQYSGYFLTMHEIVRYCKDKRILCQGRGSAANSAVCYCLGITAINPDEFDLLFERFLSLERQEPPDIDLDIEHDRREEVIQHMYDKYDRDHAAMVANVVSYRSRSAIREVGKVFGISAVTLDQCAKRLSHWGGNIAEAMMEVGLDLGTAVNKNVAEIAEQLTGFPRHLSIHPGGFLLGSDPVHTIVPIENATMENRTVIQWDKRDIEELNLFKVDLLGLGALSQLDYCFALLERHHKLQLNMASIPIDDVETYDMICRADTVGVFQIESRAQMSMLPRLRPRTYYDIVIEVSIVRPGPITGGMVHPFLNRRNGDEEVTYPHESLEPVLHKTLGIPLFQEQVMKIAVVGANYTPGEADQLRRDMAAWTTKGRMHRHEERLISGMRSNGIAEEFAQRIYKQITGFGEYGFPESHAASFALIAYATSYIKCHYPDVFACSLLNAWPMGFYSPATIIDDAKRHGVAVLPMDVSKSEWECTLEALPETADTQESTTTQDADTHTAATHIKTDPSPNRLREIYKVPFVPGYAIRIGMRYLKGFSRDVWKIVKGQRTRQTFGSLADFKNRCRIPREAFEKLSLSGSLECFGVGRRSALWMLIDEGAASLRAAQPVDEAVRESGLDVGAAIYPDSVLSDPETSQQELLPYREGKAQFLKLSPADLIGWDYITGHHSSRGHPLETLRPMLTARGLPDAARVIEMEILKDGATTVAYAGFVICRQQPMTANNVLFMTLEDETGFVNIIVWPDIYKQYRTMILTNTILGVTGTLQKNGAKNQKVEAENKSTVVYIVAESFWVPSLFTPGAEPPIQSRDFH